MTKQTDTFRIPRQKRVKLVTPRSVYAKYTLIYALCYTAAFAVGALFRRCAARCGRTDARLREVGKGRA